MIVISSRQNYRVGGENEQREIIALAYRFAKNMIRVHRFHARFLIEARGVGEAAGINIELDFCDASSVNGSERML